MSYIIIRHLSKSTNDIFHENFQDNHARDKIDRNDYDCNDGYSYGTCYGFGNTPSNGNHAGDNSGFGSWPGYGFKSGASSGEGDGYENDNI